jgi:hypothetical protein
MHSTHPPPPTAARGSVPGDHPGPVLHRIRPGKSTVTQPDRFCPVHGYYPAYLGTCPRCH